MLVVRCRLDRGNGIAIKVAGARKHRPLSRRLSIALMDASQSRARLRNSCDACNAAKVKCSKERPCCRRCDRRNVLCVYSVSLRPSRRQPHAELDPSSTAAHAAAAQAAAAAATSTATDAGAECDFSTATDVNSLSLPAFDDYFDDVMAGMPLLSPPQHHQHHQHQPATTTATATPLQLHHAHYGQPHPYHQHPVHVPVHHGTTPPACGCQQLILAKLSTLCPTAAPNQGLPFDRALSENRSIVALCNSTLDCALCARGDDAVLLFTLAALLAHVLGVLDALFRARREALRPREADAFAYDSLHLLTPPPTAPPTSAGTGGSGQATHAAGLAGECAEWSEPQPAVRLSLGSYELDERDEQMLQMNLFKIELGKITALVDAFEARLSRLGAGPANDTKLHQDITIYLKQRLRANVDAPKLLARANGCVDI
ncbi:hypothetical protein ACJQWK_01539 [Exserohilum turcicum]